MTMTNTLTRKQAYLAMYAFLENYYDLSKADDVGALLGGLSLTADGSPLDSAFWVDWEEAVQRVMDGDVDAEIELSGGNIPP